MTTRFFSVVLAFGLVFAAERFQGWLDENQGKAYLAPITLLGIGFLTQELWQNQLVWRLPNIARQFGEGVLEVQRFYVNNKYDDTVFLWTFWGGLAITCVTAGVLLWLSVRENRRMKQKRPEPQPARVM